MSILSKIKNGLNDGAARALHQTNPQRNNSTSLGIVGVGETRRVRENHLIDSPRGSIPNPAHPVDILSAMKNGSTKGMQA